MPRTLIKKIKDAVMKINTAARDAELELTDSPTWRDQAQPAIPRTGRRPAQGRSTCGTGAQQDRRLKGGSIVAEERCITLARPRAS